MSSHLVREGVGERSLALERRVLPRLQHGLDLLNRPRPVVPVVGGEAAAVARPLLQPNPTDESPTLQQHSFPRTNS
jgi:hypothetical protein